MCQRDPAAAYAANVGLVFDVIESCRAVGGVTFVFPSTGLVYRDRSGPARSEDAPVHASSVYAGTKLAAEMLITAYAGAFCSAIIARLSNVYGPGAAEATVVGRILGQALRREPIVIQDESPIRDFVFVEDVVEAFIRLFLSAQAARVVTVNVSANQGTSIGELASLASTLSSLPCGEPIMRDCSAEREDSLVLANEQLRCLTGWVPKTGLSDGLRVSLQESVYV
jgi:nucleoside-diphosphate-sugar epimerase